MADFVSTSGAQVRIAPASFDDAMALKNAITGELAASGVDLSAMELRIDADVNLATLLPIAARMDSSEKVQACLWPCLARCTYNKERITKATFEASEARQDYYEIVIACLKENLSPFFAGLISKLKLNSPKTTPASQA